MEAIKDTVGDSEILIQTAKVEIQGGDSDPFGTLTTSVKPEEIEGAYARAKSLIKSIANDIGTEIIDELKGDTMPTKFEIEFNLGFSANANAWFLSAGSEYALSIRMIWQTDQHNA